MRPKGQLSCITYLGRTGIAASFLIGTGTCVLDQFLPGQGLPHPAPGAVVGGQTAGDRLLLISVPRGTDQVPT